MKKAHFDKQISAYLDGEIRNSEREKIDKHLLECSQCQELFQIFKETREAALKIEGFRVSPYFAKKVIANFQTRERESFWNSFDFLPRPIIHAALVVSVIILVILPWPLKQDTQTLEDLSDTSDYTAIFVNGANETLTTNDQALQFALNDGSEVLNGGAK